MKKVLLICALLVASVLVFISYSGMFHAVAVNDREIGPYTMIVKKHTGSYYKTGAVFDEVGSLLEKRIDKTKLIGVGLYYDDPAKVEEDKLRSECGFIVEQGDLEKIGPLAEGLFLKEFTKTRCAVVEFPLKTFLSYMIGPSKAYPKLAEYLKGKTTDADYGMEIYDTENKIIQYCMPLKTKI